MGRVIVFIDMDAFFASVEQAINPFLKNKAVIVMGRENPKRSVVCSASYEAKKYGIESGMPTYQASRLLPSAIFLPAQTSKYLYVSQKIWEMLTALTLPVTRLSIDEFVLDASSRFSSGEKAEGWAREIKERIRKEFRVTCSIGIGESVIISKVACNLGKPDGLVVLSKKEFIQRVKDLPVEKIPGVGEATRRKLSTLGVTCWGDLLKVSLSVLKETMGKWGVYLYFLARGEDIEEIWRVESTPKSIGHSTTFPRILEEEEEVRKKMRILSEMVARRLRKLRMGGKVLRLSIHIPGKGVVSRQRNFSSPTWDGERIYKRAWSIFDGLGRPKVRAMGISVSGLSYISLPLLEEEKKRNSLLQALDRVNDQEGEWTIFPASLL